MCLTRHEHVKAKCDGAPNYGSFAKSIPKSKQYFELQQALSAIHASSTSSSTNDTTNPSMIIANITNYFQASMGNSDHRWNGKDYRIGPRTMLETSDWFHR